MRASGRWGSAATRWIGAAAAAFAGCDLGEPQRPEPPALHVLETSPAAGEGTDCPRGAPSCGAPIDGGLRVRFDRPLWPEPASFETVRVFTGSSRNRVAARAVHYELVDWTVRYELTQALEPRALYQVELPGERPGPAPRAFDGATLEPGPVPLRFSFLTGERASAAVATPAAPDCEAIIPVLTTHCAGGCCHGGPAPAMGLRLDSREGLVTTALRRVARQTEIAGSAGVPLAGSARFGAALPLLDPGSAATSYLLYKLLIAPDGFPPCADPGCAAFTALPGAESCEPWPEAERHRVRDWFVQGEPMPLRRTLDPSCATVDAPPLDCASLRALIHFVDAGAQCD